MGKILWYIYFGVYLLLSSTYKIKMRYLKKRSQQEADEYVFRRTQKFSKHILRKSKTKMDVKGTENIPKGACVFIANHQAIFDGFMLSANINKPIGFIAKKEITKLPLISSWLSDIHSVFIDRSNVRESVKGINQGVENLKNGYSMVIFPEGTRSLSSKMGEFKKGSIKLAIKAGVPIVPITMDGNYKILETGNQVRGNKVKMVIHKPIYVDQISKEEQKELTGVIHNIINQELLKFQ